VPLRCDKRQSIKDLAVCRDLVRQTTKIVAIAFDLVAVESIADRREIDPSVALA